MSEHAIDAILMSPTPSPPSKRRHNCIYATSCDTDDVFEATMLHISVQESINGIPDRKLCIFYGSYPMLMPFS